jgi:RecA-family ATPase
VGGVTDYIEQSDRLQLCRFADLLRRVPAPWQIRGVLREQSVSLLYGRRGCYKSFLALDLATCLATGTPWHDHAIPTPGLVLYIAGEGGGGMVQRARAWVEAHGLAPSVINLLFIIEPVVVTATSDDMDLLIERIREAIGWLPAGTPDPDDGHIFETPLAHQWPALIVIDTLARCFIGDENAPEDMGQFIQGVDRLKHEFNTSVLILHHTGRDESHERGHTALGGACDTVYRVDHDAETQTLTLTNEKMKDAREPAPMDLSYREVLVTRRAGDDPDEDLTSVIIVSAAENAAARTAHALQVLVETGPLTWVSWCQVSGLPRATFARLVVRLTKSGEIVKENEKWRKR